MVVGMVTYRVAGADHLLKGFGVFPDVIAHAKEGSRGIEFLQLLKHPGSYFGNGPVIKSKIDTFIKGGHAPQKAGVYDFQDPVHFSRRPFQV
ncbi:hypothetical protein D9M69_664930 [compost metagenome]